MRFRADCYRAHDPRWSFAPLSGDGAKLYGGRFNPAGVPALYLALSMDGALNEASQSIPGKLEPLTLCLYEVDCDDVLDLQDETVLSRLDVDPADLAAGWRKIEALRTEPPTWALARRLIAQGTAGILVPSFADGARPDATNLVLWRWGPDLPHRVRVHDPSGRLPADQHSWLGRRAGFEAPPAAPARPRGSEP